MDYARALVEHPRWRWEPGMVDTDGRVAVCGKSGIHGRPMMGKTVQVGPFLGGAVDYVDDARPDINHPATKGWLLHMLLGVAEAVHFETDPNGSAEVYVKWSIDGEAQRRWFRGDEALAAALLAVWGQA